ncbi:alpha/beta hydrolase [Piscinibacter sp.]|uniref:alpha/beta hydrolase n=1 Tax=Piscinibacter sp. TaxID=1903157 RepID=UPI002C27DE3E|nr:alpha/beta fold hydrolase [Albitalea sp.]HUG25541.1 alpha/beta fold hydrolase [Albitalea sp.]
MRAGTAVLLAGLVGLAWGSDASTACRVAGIRNEVQCGVVQRPLDPSRPAGPTIAVHYVVVPAMARRKLPDPVFLLAGGPGQSAIELAPTVLPLFNRLNNRRDIVFVDQRGTGRSAPLNCEEPPHRPLSEQADPQRQHADLVQCREALQKLPHGDLRQYTTTIAVQDLDAVRRQLGAGQINLVGVSYGTRVALEYQRQFPDPVRRSVIDGVAPPDMVLPASFSTDGQAALDAMLAACEDEPACTKTYPTLRTDWAALLKSLPRPVAVPHPLSGDIERFTLTREMVLAAVRGPLYAPAIAAALPRVITEATRGRFEPLVGIASLLGSRKATALATGMHFSVVCSEDLQRGPLAQDVPGLDFGVEFAALYRRVCADWPRGDVPAAFYTVAPTASPVLVASGGLDPVTPPRHGARVALSLGEKAVHVVVPNAGHGVLAIGCMRDVMFRFIDAEDDTQALAVDAACVKDIPRPPAYRPITLSGAGE